MKSNTSTETGIKLEVCIDSVESALAAVRGGADRLEICGNLALGGGTTPSIGLVRLVKHSCPAHIELMAMVRPRTGDFLYSTMELATMLEDIRVFAELGITGVVFGALCANGTVDSAKTRTLVDEAVRNGMQVCFHRAFDMVVDQQEALFSLRSIPGIARILTSGGAPSAPTGLPSLISLCSSLQTETQIKPPLISSETAQENFKLPSRSPATPGGALIQIMPGSGINAHTAAPLLRALLPLGPSVRALHLSGGGFVSSSLVIESESESESDASTDNINDTRGGTAEGMLYRPEGMGMGVGVGVGGAGEWGVWRTSEPAVRAVREVVDKEWKAYLNA